MLKKLLAGLAALVAVIVAFGFYKTLQEPADLWAITGSFAACPSRPSCVSSVAEDPVHRVAPLIYQGDIAAARQRLEQAVSAMPGAQLQHATAQYLHVLFLTPRMRFHDDVELLLQAGGQIQVRSISRFGYRDHGVNRARVEALRAAFAPQATGG